jgi:hypothetical protein
MILNIDGDQIEVDEKWLADMLSWRLPGVDFQWWIDGDVDIICRFSYQPCGCEVQTFYLDGLTSQQVSLLERTLVDYLRANIEIETLGLVVDRRGETVGICDWDEIVPDGRAGIPCFPDVLVLPEERFSEVASQAGGRVVKRLPGGLVSVGE